MARIPAASLRLRLILLVCLALLPALGLAVLRNLEDRQLVRDRAFADARRLVHSVALEQGRVFDSSRLLLAALGQVPEVRRATPGACDRLLADLLARNARFSNLGRTDAAGNVICSATPTAQAVSVGDRDWFIRARDTRAFARGEYQVGRVTGQPNVVSAVPLFDAEGRFEGAVYAGLLLSWLNDLVATTTLPPDATMLVVGSQGTILARYPDGQRFVGQTLPDLEHYRDLANAGHTTVAATGLDGVPRIYAFMRLAADGGPEYAIVGLPEALIDAEYLPRLWRSLIAVVVVGGLAICLGLVGADRLVLGRVRALTDAAARLRRGDLAARSGLAAERDELGRLASTFDGMAASLESRERELREARDQLEARVATRTSDLVETNRRLWAELTERQRAEAALTRLTALHELILNSTQEGIYGLDLDGRTTFVNQAAARLTGYSVDELLGRQDLHALLHHADAHTNGARAAADECAIHTALRTQATVAAADAVLWRRDGSHLPVEVTCTPMRAGDATVGIVVTLRDIAARQAVAAALSTQWAYLKRVIDSIPTLMVVVDADDRYSLVNQAYAEHRGLSQEEIVGKRLADFYEDPELVSQVIEENAQIRASEEPLFASARPVVNPGTKESRWLEKIKVPLTAPDGQSRHVLTVLIDVTDHREALEALQRSEAQLIQSQKMEAIGRLAGGVAHDFNNLLTVILSCAEILQLQLSPDHAVRPFVDDMASAAQRAADLTRQLLAFSRQQVLAPELVDLSNVVAEADKLLRRIIGEDIELVTVLRPGLGRVRVDPAQMQQIIINLAVNARDAMPTGGKLTIEMANVLLDEPVGGDTEALPAGDYVMLAVTDTGSGMSKEIQAHVFEPFFTTKEVGKGTGLGLSMVYGIIKQSSGEVRVYSEPGLGTTFKIYLPRVPDPAEAETTPSGTPLLLPGQGTLLLVEDEENVRGVAARALESCGYDVLVATTPDEAIELLAAHEGPLDLLITDVVMPGMNGRELAVQVRARHPDTPVLYMSGYPDRAIGERGTLPTGLAFLQKPFTPSTLTRRVRDLLRAARAVAT